MTSNSTETRQVKGYKRKWVEKGKTRVSVDCPFCGTELIAYVWSLAGSGKKCQCGAKMDMTGTFSKDRTNV